MVRNDPDTLTGATLRDQYGRTYTVTNHLIEADELQIERKNETTAITLMDIAAGPYEVVDA